MSEMAGKYAYMDIYFLEMSWMYLLLPKMIISHKNLYFEIILIALIIVIALIRWFDRFFKGGEFFFLHNCSGDPRLVWHACDAH